MQTQSKVRLAHPSDEPEILNLCRMMHAEGGMRGLDMERVRETLARAFEKKGGILAVIGVPGHIRAMQFLLLTQYWYTTDMHIEELFNWVHPDHRNSDYSKLLIEHAKKCSDQLSADAGSKIPLLMGIMTNRRVFAKVRLYRRFFGVPSGAFFVHNAPWVNRDELCEEDLWRVPKIARPFFKRTDQAAHRQEKSRVRA